MNKDYFPPDIWFQPNEYCTTDTKEIPVIIDDLSIQQCGREPKSDIKVNTESSDDSIPNIIPSEYTHVHSTDESPPDPNDSLSLIPHCETTEINNTICVRDEVLNDQSSSDKVDEISSIKINEQGIVTNVHTIYFSSGRKVPLRSDQELDLMAKDIFPVSIHKLKENLTSSLPLNVEQKYLRGNTVSCLWESLTEDDIDDLLHVHIQLKDTHRLHCGCLYCLSSLQLNYFDRKVKSYGKSPRYFKNPNHVIVSYSDDYSDFVFTERDDDSFNYEDDYHSESVRFAEYEWSDN